MARQPTTRMRSTDPKPALPANGNGPNGGINGKHTPEDAWRIETENSRRLGRVEEQVDGLANSVIALQTDSRYIRESVAQLVDRDSRPLNWGWLIAGIAALLAMLAGYSTLNLDPIRADVSENHDKHEERVRQDVRDARWRGRTEAEIDEIYRRLEVAPPTYRD